MNSKKIFIRPASVPDAAQLLDLWDAVDSETEFMLFEPGERKTTLEQQTDRLVTIKDSPNACLYVAEHATANQLVGFAAGRRDTNFRDDHKLHIVVGLRLEYTGQGLGELLMQKLEDWSVSHAIHRLELSVSVTNLRAIGLYKKLGFELEGTKRDSIKLKSGFVDEHVMGKLIS